MRALLIAGALALVNFSALAAENQPYMELTIMAPIYPGDWEHFCKQHADECVPPVVASSPIVLTEEKRQELKRVNDEFNRHLGGFNTPNLPCVEVAREKRNALIAAGWPPDSVLLTIVHLPGTPKDASGKEVNHMVVTVRTIEGDYILDCFLNRYKVILWSETRYKFLSRQQLGSPSGWVHVEDTRFPPTTDAN